MPIEGGKGYHVDLEPAAGDPGRPVWFQESRVIATPLPGRLRLAGTLELAGLDESVSRVRVEAIVKAARKGIAGLDGRRVLEVWRGLRPCTPDGLPLVGRSETPDNLVLASGHAMMGLTLAPVTGRLVGEIVDRGGAEPRSTSAAAGPFPAAARTRLSRAGLCGDRRERRVSRHDPSHTRAPTRATLKSGWRSGVAPRSELAGSSRCRIRSMAELGTMRVKGGLAEMLKGGVIMDVTTAEQARIAEDAGAVAVMALERVPADIRAQGGVARMADPTKIQEIQEAVTIPVMAKCRIGHFVEAADPRGARGRLHRRERGADSRRRGAPRRQVEVPRAVRLRLPQPRRGAAADQRGCRDDPNEGRGRHGRHRQRRPPHAGGHRRDPPAAARCPRRSSSRLRRSCRRRSSSSSGWPSTGACRS